MGWKTECKKALRPNQEVTIMFDGLEYTGIVINNDNKSNDSSVTIELKDKRRVIIPVFSGKATVMYKPAKQIIEAEKEQKKSKTLEKPGEVPR